MSPYHVSWGVVVPNLVPPVWLVDYKPGEPETGLVYGNGVDLPGVRNSGFVNFDPEHRVVDREIEDAAVRRQALLADERMSDITSIETLIDEIEGGNRETRFFPFDGWIWVLVMSLEVLAGRASFEKVARMPEWANADARARKVLEAVAMR